MTAGTDDAPSMPRTWRGLYNRYFVLISWCALAVPVMLVRIPPLLDYPGHLARIWLLAGGAQLEPISRIYAVNWPRAWTNIGIDLIAATIGRILPTESLGSILVLAAIVLPPIGAAILHREITLGASWWRASFPIFAWNTTLMLGFLNFQIGIGLALIAAAYTGRSSIPFYSLRAIVLRLAICSILSVFHIFAGFLYCAIIGAIAFGADFKHKIFKHFLEASLRGAGAFLSCGLPVLLSLYLLKASQTSSHHMPPVKDSWPLFFVFKTGTLISPFYTCNLTLDLLFGLTPLMAVIALMRFHKINVHFGLGLLAACLYLSSPFVPRQMADTAFIDIRFPVMGLFVGLAAIRADAISSSLSAPLTVVFTVLSVLRCAWIGEIWRDRQSDFEALSRALSHVPSGAAIAPVQVPVYTDFQTNGRYLFGNIPFHDHFADLAIPWRRAFSPTLFTQPGKQPIKVLPPWDEIATDQGSPAFVNLLTHYDPDTDAYFNGFMANWRTRFDFVLLLSADRLSNPSEVLPNKNLRLVDDEGFIRLYEVIKD
jgi:hypothetical protein